MDLKPLMNHLSYLHIQMDGDVPAEVENFLMVNGTLVQGVVCSGDTGYGDAYCQAADKISEDYGCEILYKVENSGTPEDIENIKKVIGA